MEMDSIQPYSTSSFFFYSTHCRYIFPLVCFSTVGFCIFVFSPLFHFWFLSLFPGEGPPHPEITTLVSSSSFLVLFFLSTFLSIRNLHEVGVHFPQMINYPSPFHN